MIVEPTIAIAIKGKLTFCEHDKVISYAKGGKHCFPNAIDEVVNTKRKDHVPATSASAKCKG